ncbi:MAG: nickel-dependent hydrogenase large subunit [Desulfobacterium sp.]|jgi:hydrogenase large subunit|nr:nickel-dependent hydrogenase large subunit [Desulfobacterium sp.]
MVKRQKGINIPINRAEGDLEVVVDITDGVITDAWSSGTLFRGFEGMMQGRGALDGLVITPRICGICSLTHLMAAVEALDAITGIKPPDNAFRLRNLALMVETIQSDVRQAVLMFMVDFANKEAYGNHSLGKEAQLRYSPLKGRASIEVIRETKKLIEIIAVIGGQWPHTSFMVPGGVTSIPGVSKLLQCRLILEHFTTWYERSILGCSLGRWQAIQSVADLDEWLAESPKHRDSEVGFFVRFAREAGLHSMGRGPNRFLSYGSFRLPGVTSVQGVDGMLTAAGFATGSAVSCLDPLKITEDISHAWFEPGNGPSHPSAGETKPYASGQGGDPYSWVKAPRYMGQVVETGPLAEMIINGDGLFVDFLHRDGPNAFIRELARFVRPVRFLTTMPVWVDELVADHDAKFYHRVKGVPDGRGQGMIQAARGALGHWVKIRDNTITHYQIITPTSWNGSPRDESGERGAWEQALIGTPVRDVNNPVEAGHVIRSFDPCLVCAVHTVVNGKKTGRLTLG